MKPCPRPLSNRTPRRLSLAERVLAVVRDHRRRQQRDRRHSVPPSGPRPARRD